MRLLSTVLCLLLIGCVSSSDKTMTFKPLTKQCKPCKPKPCKPKPCKPNKPVLQATSFKQHGGILPVRVASGEVECREGGVTWVKWEFDQPVFGPDGSQLQPTNFQVNQGEISHVSHTHEFFNLVEIWMTGVGTGTFEISADLSTGFGTKVRRYKSCWPVLAGDATGDRKVVLQEEASLCEMYNGMPAEACPSCDIDVDNVIEWGPNGDDRLWAVENDGASVDKCKKKHKKHRKGHHKNHRFRHRR